MKSFLLNYIFSNDTLSKPLKVFQ